MYEEFQSLKESIRHELSNRYVSKNPCAAFSAATNKMESYLVAKEVGYSSEIAEKWIAELDNNAPRHQVYRARRMIGFIEGLRKTGVVPREIKVERKTKLSRLPGWCQAEINEFLVKYGTNHSTRQTKPMVVNYHGPI